MTIVAKVNIDGTIEYVEEDLPDFTEPTPVPTLTPRQIRFVLNQYNLRAQVEALISQADQYTKDWWEWSNEFKHDHPVLIAMAYELNLTQEQVDQLFREGALL